MSLLLQALRQIESKTPLCSAPKCDLGPRVDPYVALTAKVDPPVDTAEPPCNDAPPINLTTLAERQFAEGVLTYLEPSDRVLALVSADAAVLAAPFAGNLAFGLAAHENQNVLLIEPAASSLNRMAQGVRPVDFAALFAGRVAWHEATSDTRARNLSILHAAAPGPDSRLPAADLRESWRGALELFQYVVLHTTGIADSASTELLASCDAAFLLIRIGQTARSQAQRRTAALQRAGVNLRACLLVPS